MKRQSVGKLVKRLRKEKGLSQRKLEKLSGVNRAYICQLEAGKAMGITVRTAGLLAKGLQVSPGVFFEESNYYPQEDQLERDLREFFDSDWKHLTDVERDLVRCFVNIIREHRAGREPPVHSEVLHFIETRGLLNGGPCHRSSTP